MTSNWTKVDYQLDEYCTENKQLASPNV